jgi:hypothetical protein
MEDHKPYSVLNPNENYLGKSYGNWVAEWTNWFYSIDPDIHNEGPVVFIRNMPFPTLNSKRLPYEPMVMIGNDKLEIFEDQVILVPVVTANYVATELWNSNNTDSFLRGIVRSHLFGGDFPPSNDQLTIDGKPIHVDMNQYLIESPTFSIFLPNVEKGRSLKDYMEEPLPSGIFHCVTSGYFLLIKLVVGKHVIHSYARGLKTDQGEFYSELLYQVDVSSRNESPKPPRIGVLPSKLSNVAINKAREKLESHEIDQQEYEILKTIVENARENTKNRIDRGIKSSYAS